MGYFHFTVELSLDKDRDKALARCQEAAAQGHTEAMFNVASFAANGLHPDLGPKDAADLLYRALRGGSELALDALLTNADKFPGETWAGLQQILADKGLYDGAVDGAFGPGTRRAVLAAYGIFRRRVEMTKSTLPTFLLALGLLCALPAGSAMADCHEVEPEIDLPSDDEFPSDLSTISCHSDDAGPGQGLNTGVTKSIVKILQGANRTCDRRIELRYRIDCLRLYYLKVAANLPDSGDYLPIKKAMLNAADKLDAIVTKYEDESAPVIRPREGHNPGTKRLPRVRPVKEAFAEAAAVEAAMVVEETELIIIRSGGDPARRTQHYTEVAAAVEDNLVILRST